MQPKRGNKFKVLGGLWINVGLLVSGLTRTVWAEAVERNKFKVAGSL